MIQLIKDKWQKSLNFKLLFPLAFASILLATLAISVIYQTSKNQLKSKIEERGEFDGKHHQLYRREHFTARRAGANHHCSWCRKWC
ncbi:hypothetical protein [Deefgea sp. CFH1-16]|uniref:hypothetical protein n=1 Tax=Deefgea sp. CFH1-16 TaxID=2675457 RepID=UPI0015F50CC7|nr:hypothetical protein [Deefgea sp. CFH1-16]MBM5575078.1 hypothetical protein [Deefgea sp. CFH1-16]